MFSDPISTYGKASLEQFYWMVCRELTGIGPSDELFASVQPGFLSALGDSKEAGGLLTHALAGIEWDWPRWKEHAAKEGYDTVDGLHKWAARLTSKDLVAEASKPELTAMASTLGLTVKPSATRQVLIDQIATQPPAKLKALLQPVMQRVLQKAVERCRRSMGQFVAVRVMNLANNAHHYQQLLEPDFRALRPFWKFVCVMDARPPKACRTFNKKVLPVAVALQTFPSLPCDVLNCCCRVHAVATAKG